MQQKNTESLNIPSDMICPITHEIMREPVLLIGSGHTYESEAIEEWFKNNKTDPSTNEELTNFSTVPNLTIQRMISSFIDQEKILHPEILDEVYLPKSYIINVLNSLSSADISPFHAAMQKDSRLWTLLLEKDKNLFVLVCERASEKILEYVLNHYGESILSFPYITQDQGISAYCIVGKRLGLAASQILAKALKWESSHFKEVLELAVENNDMDITYVVLASNINPSQSLFERVYIENQIEWIKLFIKFGMPLDHEDDQGHDFLMRTIVDGKDELTLFLLTEIPARLNLNHCNHKQQTPLHLAVLHQQFLVVEFLCAFPEVDRMLKDAQGKTALDLAIHIVQQGYEEVTEYLPLLEEPLTQDSPAILENEKYGHEEMEVRANQAILDFCDLSNRNEELKNKLKESEKNISDLTKCKEKLIHDLYMSSLENKPSSTVSPRITQSLQFPLFVLKSEDSTKISLEEKLKIFLKYVVYGEQAQAEIMVKENPSLALMQGEIQDWGGREFKCISGFQYAVWALDWHMWEMLKSYLMPQFCKEMGEQLDALSTQAHGSMFDLNPLINAYRKYIKEERPIWKPKTKVKHFVQDIGRLQRLLPLHILQEYCRSDRKFIPVPDFEDKSDLRIGVENHDLKRIIAVTFADKGLGKTLAIGRGDAGRISFSNIARKISTCRWIEDGNAIEALFKKRLQQREELIRELKENHLLNFSFE